MRQYAPVGWQEQGCHILAKVLALSSLPGPGPQYFGTGKNIA